MGIAGRTTGRERSRIRRGRSGADATIRLLVVLIIISLVVVVVLAVHAFRVVSSSSVPLNALVAIRRRPSPATSSSSWMPYREGAPPAELYAASWFMARDRFVEASATELATNLVALEAAFFAPIALGGRGLRDARRSKDWLDWSVEHLSLHARLLRSERGNLLVAAKCRDYADRQMAALRRSRQNHPPSWLLMNRTLAVLPFYSGGHNDTATTDSRDQLLVAELVATIASLLPHAPKRIVVVGHSPRDARLVSEAVAYLRGGRPCPLPRSSCSLPSAHPSFPTEVAYVQPPPAPPPPPVPGVPPPPAVHLPRTALLRLAEELSSGSPGDHRCLLGPHATPWDYDHIYYTEPDQILLSRVVPHPGEWWEELATGAVLVPHRLQPLPHPRDVGAAQTTLPHLLPPDTPVVDLPAWETAACCDISGTVVHYHDNDEGRDPWWAKGFLERDGGFSALDGYSLMALGGGGGDAGGAVVPGTGMVLLGGSVQGGKCRPEPHGRHACR